MFEVTDFPSSTFFSFPILSSSSLDSARPQFQQHSKKLSRSDWLNGQKQA